MVTRNSTNKLEFDTQEWGATVSYFAINTGTALDNETNPGEAVEAIVELIAQRGTIMSLGLQVNGLFHVAIENNGWSAADLQTELQGLGATVGTNNYDCSTTTAQTFNF
tara:strand:+ start:1396 stop:1722 length:327 start_codon:yes stop_codon:yes gene_type:complete